MHIESFLQNQLEDVFKVFWKLCKSKKLNCHIFPENSHSLLWNSMCAVVQPTSYDVTHWFLLWSSPQFHVVIKSRKWRWIGHTLRKPVTDIRRHALSWNPAGKTRRGRLRNTWQRSIEDEAKKVGKSWPQIRTLAKNRVRWRTFVDGLCSALSHGHK